MESYDSHTKKQQVTLSGWVQRVRNKGFMIWVDLRDRYGITQLIFDEERTDKAVFEQAKTLSREDVIQIQGTVIKREASQRKYPYWRGGDPRFGAHLAQTTLRFLPYH